MLEYCTFDDVLIQPQFSTIKSRKEVDLTTKLGNLSLKFPILSANMDTVTGDKMAVAMYNYGGLGVLHRFWSIGEQCYAVAENLNGVNFACSIGLGELGLERAKEMINRKCRTIVIDVAHGAQQQVVEQFKNLRECLKNYKIEKDVHIVVGNFATGSSVLEFIEACGFGFVSDFNEIASIKVGIGPGAACTTRIKTGVGVPQLSAIIDCVKTGVNVIADGGMKTPGDIAKALAAGAKAVMLGSMLAGTDESPGEVFCKTFSGLIGSEIFVPPNDPSYTPTHKKYRGSASKESYSDQGKDASHRTAEGEAFLIPYKGSVASVLQDIEGGLRSAFTYVGANNLTEFQERAKLIRVSANSVKENNAHGKANN